jgi:ATP-dependent Clp protease protease subunit
MLEERIIFLNGEVNDHTTYLMIQQFLWLDHVSDAPIKFYLNSPGGSVSAGLAIYDTIATIKSPITVFGYGNCASMGCILLSAKYDRPGCKRYVLPSCRVMAHQVRGGAGGQCSDMLIEAKLMTEINEDLFQKIATWTGQPYEKIKADANRDYWMTAEKAVEEGYADAVFTG